MNNINKSSAYESGYDDFNIGKPFSNPYYDDFDDENYYGCDSDKDYKDGYMDAEYDYWDDD